MQNQSNKQSFLRAQKTTFGVILFAYFTPSAFSEKYEKSMPEWLPKSMKNHQKVDPGTTNRYA